MIDYLDVYFVGANGAVSAHQTGDRRPYDSREVDDRNFFFSFQVPPGERVTVPHSKCQGRFKPLVVTTPAEFRSSMAREYVLQGMYARRCLPCWPHNLLLYTSLRERTYLYRGLPGAVRFDADGFQRHGLSVPGPTHQLKQPGCADPDGADGAALTQFSRDFLGLKQHWPKMDKAVLVTLWSFLAVAAGGLTMAYTVPIRLGTLRDDPRPDSSLGDCAR